MAPAAGPAYTVLVSYGYHYALSYSLNRLASRTVLGVAPVIRHEHAELVWRRGLRWRADLLGVLGLVGLLRVRSTQDRPGRRSQR